MKTLKSYAPMELVVEFLASVMSHDYHQAKVLCQRILEVEPENETCKEFSDVLNIAASQEEEDSKGEDSDTSDDEEDDSTSGEEAIDDGEYESDLSYDEASDNETGSETSDDNDEDLTMDEINRLNLLMGGLKIIKP